MIEILFAIVAYSFGSGGGVQDPVVDVSPEYARTYELEPVSPERWPEGCHVRWTMSDDQSFRAEARQKVLTGRWRVEIWGNPSDPRRRTVLILDGLVDNGERGCGVSPSDGEALLDLMSLRDGTLFIVNRDAGPGGIPMITPQVRLRAQVQ